jgi:hypothetical protein
LLKAASHTGQIVSGISDIRRYVKLINVVKMVTYPACRFIKLVHYTVTINNCSRRQTGEHRIQWRKY